AKDEPIRAGFNDADGQDGKVEAGSRGITRQGRILIESVRSWMVVPLEFLWSPLAGPPVFPGRRGVDGSRPSEPLAMGIPGEIHVMIGPVFSGKTAALLRWLLAERETDTVTKLKARCELCGKHASFTLRKSGEMQTELIGGADVCRQHYIGSSSKGRTDTIRF
ncbi:hypothetical protein EJ110_NYTH16942, partial [Nymphaea thermarum]